MVLHVVEIFIYIIRFVKVPLLTGLVIVFPLITPICTSSTKVMDGSKLSEGGGSVQILKTLIVCD